MSVTEKCNLCGNWYKTDKCGCNQDLGDTDGLLASLEPVCKTCNDTGDMILQGHTRDCWDCDIHKKEEPI